MDTYESLLAAITPKGGETREVHDPATGELIGTAPVQTVEDLEAAIDKAEAAQPAWAALSDDERKAYLHRAADAIDASAEALAELLSREQGKPLNGPNARFEVGGCSVWTRTAADTPLPVEGIVDDESGYAEMHYRPIGVVGAISPWDWPMMSPIGPLAPSLRMGNTVVIKPAETTTLSVLALVTVMNQVLPEGVLNIVTGPGRTVGDALTRSPKIGKIMFTGSTPVGKRIIEASAGNVTRLTLELGGNDAGIVLPDVDPAEIAEGLFWGGFINTGQTCAALKRLYVHDSVYDEVVKQVRAALEEAVVLRLMSDVPLGVFLSGGVDSTAVAALVTRATGQPVQSFTVGFDLPPGSKGDMKFNVDARYAALAAKALGAQHHTITVRQDGSLADLFPHLIYAMDEPVVQPAIVQTAYVAALARLNGVPVLPVPPNQPAPQ